VIESEGLLEDLGKHVEITPGDGCALEWVQKNESNCDYFVLTSYILANINVMLIYFRLQARPLS
jgi:hypothetical protein